MATNSGLPTTTWSNLLKLAYTGQVSLAGASSGNNKIALINSTGFTAVAYDSTHGWAGISANEVSGTGWSAGGRDFSTAASGSTSLSPTLDAGTLTAGSTSYDMNDVSVASTTLTNARAAVLYMDAVTAATADPIWCVVNFGADYSTSNGTFGIQWASTGVFAIDLTP
jgi:hypothetical protein